MKNQLIKMILSSLNSKTMAEVAISVLYELAKMSDNKVDDAMVEAVANALNIKLNH